MAETTTYKVVGTRPIRHDGVDKVTGRAIYGADVQMAGLCMARSCAAPMPMRASAPSTSAGPWPCLESKRS